MKRVLLNFVGIHDGSSYPIDMSDILIESGIEIDAILSKNSANYHVWCNHPEIHTIGVTGYTSYLNYIVR